MSDYYMRTDGDCIYVLLHVCVYTLHIPVYICVYMYVYTHTLLLLLLRGHIDCWWIAIGLLLQPEFTSFSLAMCTVWPA